MLTQELSARLEKILRLGATVKDACAYCGIAPQLFYEWMKRGEDLQENPPESPTDNEQAYADFAGRMKKARALTRIQAVQTVKRAFRNAWQPAAWYLERTAPEDYGRRVVTNEITLAPMPDATGMRDASAIRAEAGGSDRLALILATLAQSGALAAALASGTGAGPKAEDDDSLTVD